MEKKKIYYITETSLPSTSANVINSLKFCDALANYSEINFFLPLTKITNLEIKKSYDLKNNFFFFNILNRNISSSFYRFQFSIKMVFKILLNSSPFSLTAKWFCWDLVFFERARKFSK